MIKLGNHQPDTRACTAFPSKFHYVHVGTGGGHTERDLDCTSEAEGCWLPRYN